MCGICKYLKVGDSLPSNQKVLSIGVQLEPRFHLLGSIPAGFSDPGGLSINLISSHHESNTTVQSTDQLPAKVGTTLSLSHMKYWYGTAIS